MARLFVAAWPPAEAVARFLHVERLSHPMMRWTTDDQWHITLRFLGEADEDAACDALERVHHGPAMATLGPLPKLLGRKVVVLPVQGLDSLAAEVGRVMAPVGADDDRQFAAHLTVARARRGGAPTVPDWRFEAEWLVDEISVVRSELHPEGARYRVVRSVTLDTA